MKLVGLSSLFALLMWVTPYYGEELEIDSNAIEILEVGIRSGDITEFGEKADWIVIQNTSPGSVRLEQGDWYLSDKGMAFPEKYKLPEIDLEAGEQVKIWCDGLNVVANEIHTNFKINSAGEDIILVFREGQGNYIEVSGLSFGPSEGYVEGYFKNEQDQVVPF